MLSLFLYRLLWRIAPPLLRRYLRRRARLAPAYALNWNERFGVAQAQAVQRPIWIHAVSVGETRAAQPVIAALQTRFPDAPLLLTQMTPTGRATAEALYPQAQCRYLPYDHPAYVAQFMREHQPLLGVIMETEIWPNLLHAADAAKIPMFLANARLSARSQRGYQKVVRLVAPALATLKATFAQTEADAQRLASIGAVNVQVSGNSKYDIEPPAPMHVLAGQFRQRIGARPVVVCASTRTDDTGQDEAALLLAAWRAYAGDALLVLVPRHPERFQAAFTQAQSLGYRVQKHSDEFKAEAVTACMQPGVSVSAIALARGVNANLLRLWLRNAEMKPLAGVDGEVSTLSMPTMAMPKSTFVPMTVPAQVPALKQDIHIEVRRNAMTVTVTWPASAAAECARWMRELLR